MPTQTAIENALTALTAQLTKAADVGLDAAKSGGADAAKVGASCAFERRLTVESKEFSLANSIETQRLGLVVHKAQRKGSAQINTLDPDAMRKASADALALASFSVPDSGLIMATQADAPAAKALPFMFDSAVTDLELGELQEIMQVGLTHAVRDPRVALDKFEFGTSTSWHGVFNSNGVRQFEKQTMLTWSFFGMAVETKAGSSTKEVSGFDYDVGFSWTRKGVEEKLRASAEFFAERVLGNLHPRKCPSYRGPVLLSPRAVEDLIVGMALYHASGSSVMDGKSQWNDAIGKEVIAPLVTIHDNPHDSRMSGATAFDSDGLPTRTHAIIERGTLRTHLHDLYTARKTNAKSTAMAGGPFALALAPGEAALSDLAGARGELLMVDRFSGNSDPVKGDFSGVAKSSRLYVKGKDAGAVSETMIAGNFFEVAKQILSASREVEIVNGAFSSPWLLIDGVSVTGG